MLQTIIAEDLVDHEWMHGKVDGFEALASELGQISPKLAAEHTGMRVAYLRSP